MHIRKRRTVEGVVVFSFVIVLFLPANASALSVPLLERVTEPLIDLVSSDTDEAEQPNESTEPDPKPAPADTSSEEGSLEVAQPVADKQTQQGSLDRSAVNTAPIAVAPPPPIAVPDSPESPDTMVTTMSDSAGNDARATVLAASDNNARQLAVIERTPEGWSILGVAWYWWLLAIGLTVGAAMLIWRTVVKTRIAAKSQ